MVGLRDKPPCFLSTKSQSSLENCVFWNASLLLGFSDGLMIVRKIKMVRLVVCNSAITSFLCVTTFHILLIFNHSPVSSLVFVCQDGDCLPVVCRVLWGTQGGERAHCECRGALEYSGFFTWTWHEM